MIGGVGRTVRAAALEHDVLTGVALRQPGAHALTLGADLLAEHRLHEARDLARRSDRHVRDRLLGGLATGRLERVGHVGGVLEALVLVAIERFSTTASKHFGIAGLTSLGGRIGSTRMRCSVAASLSALNSRLPHEHLPEDDAHREQVGAAVELVAARLLGRHVRELALELAVRASR